MLIIDRNVLAERRRLVEADLAENGFDALVLYAQGSSVGSASKSHGYMSFLTDWDSYNTPGVLVLVPGKPPVLFVANIFLKYMTEQTWWLDDVRFAAPPVLAAEVARALEERCGACRKIAYIGRGETPVPFWEGLRAATGAAEYAEYESRVDPLRVVKDPVQYSIHYRGAEICDAMFQELRREIRQGKPVYQLQNAMIRLAHDSGAEHALVWLTVGPAAEYCHFRREECQRVPQIGDQVLVGIYLLYHGHWAHALRMGTYGAPSPRSSGPLTSCLKWKMRDWRRSGPAETCMMCIMPLKGCTGSIFPSGTTRGFSASARRTGWAIPMRTRSPARRFPSPIRRTGSNRTRFWKSGPACCSSSTPISSKRASREELSET